MSSLLEVRLSRIGNSRGIRLPARLIAKFGFDGGILLEDCGDGVVLKPRRRRVPQKLSWAETAKEMSDSGEQWSDWDSASADGVKDIPWK